MGRRVRIALACWAIWAVAAPRLPAAAVRAGQTSALTYVQAVEQYRRGDFEGAVASLSAIGDSQIPAEINRFWQRLQHMPEARIALIRSAVLLHTEVAFTRGVLPSVQRRDVQLESARSLLRRLEITGEERAFTRDWYLLVVSFLHAGRDVSRSRPLLADARKRFPADPSILLASGVDHEVLSANNIGWLEFFDLDGRLLGDEQVNADRELERALAFMRSAVAAQPDADGRDEARLRLGRILHRRLDLEGASQELAAVHAQAAAAPLKYLAAVFLAMLEGDRQHHDRATELYKKAIGIYPQSQSALIGLSEAAYRRGDARSAATIMTSLLKNPPKDDPWWLYLLGEGWHFKSRLLSMRESVK
jgi:tetratricopeptide (TPR) repeat protein